MKQFSVVLLALAALAGSAALTPSINDERAALELTYDEDVLENLPPDMAFTQVAMGSFRGLAVDVLWVRAARMLRRGEYFEVLQLTEWITQLQVHFPQVWKYHAWNLTYNLSLTSSTPQESWAWVQAGLATLRDRGLPNNPESMELYHDLAWMFRHKIGGFSDSNHWHYKQELATEWHDILGSPSPASSADAVSAFQPIALAYERWVNTRELSSELRRAIEQARVKEEWLSGLEDLSWLSLRRFRARFDKWREVQRRNGEDLTSLQSVEEALVKQLSSLSKGAHSRFFSDWPQARSHIDALRRIGKELDSEFLRDSMRITDELDTEETSETSIQSEDEFLSWSKEAAQAGVLNPIVQYTQARVLVDEYHMDPTWMYELMLGEWLTHGRRLYADSAPGKAAIPIDWRHPSAHSLYWASLGVRKGRAIHGAIDPDVLSNDDQVLASLRSLARNGRILFDRKTGYYQMAIEARIIMKYDSAITMRRNQSPDGAPSLEQNEGYELFMAWAVRALYFHGDRNQAQSYYEKLRREFGKGQGRYSLALDDFVVAELLGMEGLSDRGLPLEDARTLINGLFFQAFLEGFAGGRREVSNRFVTSARRIHQSYRRKLRSENNERLNLPDFEVMFRDEFVRFLIMDSNSSGVAFSTKSRGWRGAPTVLKKSVWERVRKDLENACEKMGLDFGSQFPAP